MTRKLLSLLLAAVLLIAPCLSLAEEYLTYTDGSLSFIYPGDWMLLSRDNIDEILDAAATVDEVGAMVESARAQIEQYGMIVLMSADGADNINILLQDAGAELTGDDLLALAPSISESIAGSIEGTTFNDPEIIDINGAEALMLQYAYTLAGIGFNGVQVYLPFGAELAVCTLTSSAEDMSAGAETLGVVLGSMQLQ